MPETENRLVRPLKKAFPSKSGIFGSLLSRAVHEPEVACDIALAYEALGHEARKKLVQTVVAEAQTECIDSSALLVALLAVESDAEIARLIASNLNAIGGEVLAPSCDTDAIFAGNEREGGAIVVRPLYASFVDVYALAWNSEEGITHALIEPITSAVDAKCFAKNLPDDLAFTRAPLGFTVDMVVKVLWNHRKRFGTIPSEMQGFVGLLCR